METFLVTDRLVENSKMYRLNPSNWVDLYSEILFTEAFIILKDKKKALKVVEDTFINAMKDRPRYNQEKEEYSWLRIFFIEQLANHSVKKKELNFLKKSYNSISKKNMEIFILKTFKNIETKIICDKLKITEHEFWKSIHNARCMFINNL